MTRHLAKLLDAIWTLSMGLFLGLTGGMVLAVIITFRGAREIDATPGAEPYSDPMFAQYHNDAVAGYIGQYLFGVVGFIAIVMLFIAMICIFGKNVAIRFTKTGSAGSVALNVARGLLVVLCFILMFYSGSISESMAKDWPGLYDEQAKVTELNARRDAFDQLHKRSEQITSTAWLAGFLALVISPWCLRIADEPSESNSESKQ